MSKHPAHWGAGESVSAKMRLKQTLSAICVSTVTLGSLTGFQTVQPTTLPSNPRPGDPLPGLSANDLRLFNLGREDFLEVEEPDEGLGPLFNARSCAECHSLPAVGGTGNMVELRAGRLDN